MLKATNLNIIDWFVKFLQTYHERLFKNLIVGNEFLEGQNKMFKTFSKDLGIDLGTANTLVYQKNKGIVVCEPSIVAIEQASGKIIAYGNEAKKMIGKTSKDILVIHPMREGVIANYEITVEMLKHYIKIAGERSGFIQNKQSVVICIPSGITGVEERSVVDAVKQAGAKKASLIAEPLAAGLGAGLPVFEATGNMVVDIGGGTTEVAVLSLGGIVTSMSVRKAGDSMDEALSLYIRNQYGMLIGLQSAEQLKIQLGCADFFFAHERMQVRGRDLLTGLPKTEEITGEEVVRAIEDIVQDIVDAVKLTLEKTPPELAADIIERGIVLVGGGALLKNLDQVISQAVGIPVWVAENPMECVAIGAGQSLEHTHFS